MAIKLNKQGRRALKGIVKTVQEVLQDHANRKDFEDWYRKTYGKEYVWRYRDLETGEIYEKRGEK